MSPKDQTDAFEGVGSDFGGSVIPLKLATQQPISPEQAAEYLGEMLTELRAISAKSGFKFLTALIEVAVEEAKLQSSRSSRYADTA
jgi:hypothetical protein